MSRITYWYHKHHCFLSDKSQCESGQAATPIGMDQTWSFMFRFLPTVSRLLLARLNALGVTQSNGGPSTWLLSSRPTRQGEGGMVPFVSYGSAFEHGTGSGGLPSSAA